MAKSDGMSSDSARSGKVAWRRPVWTTVAIIFYVPTILFLISRGGPLDAKAGLPWRIIAVFVLLMTLVVRTIFRYVLPMKKSHKPVEVRQLDGARAYSLQRQAGRSSIISAHQARAFFFSVVHPAEVRKRVVERYRPNQRTLRREVFIDGQVPTVARGATHAKEREWLVPIAVPPKGRLYDNYEVDNGNGDPVSTLSYSEYLEVAACVMRTMLTLAYNSPNGTLPAKVERAEHLALIDLLYRGKPDQLTGSGAHKFPGIEALRALSMVGDDLYEPPRNQTWLNWAIALAERLARRFAVVARVTADGGGNFVVRYAETVIPPLLISEDTDLVSRAKGMARLLLGARPVDLQIGLHAAETCRSYHLYVHSEETLYLRSQEIPGLRHYFESHEGKENTIPPYYRFRSRLGQSYAHFYARYFPPAREGEIPPTTRFQFLEKPPGSVFRAAIAAVACFLLVWLVGYVSIHASDPKTDAPAFLLVVPAIAAAFLGFEASGRRLLEGTLAARSSLIVTAVTSLGASGLYVADWTKIGILPYRLSLGGYDYEILWLNRTPWCVLVVVALFNALFIAFTYFIHVWEFTHLAARPEALDGSRE